MDKANYTVNQEVNGNHKPIWILTAVLIVRRVGGTRERFGNEQCHKKENSAAGRIKMERKSEKRCGESIET